MSQRYLDQKYLSGLELKQDILNMLDERIVIMNNKNDFQVLERLQKLKSVLEKTEPKYDALQSFINAWMSQDVEYFGFLSKIIDFAFKYKSKMLVGLQRTNEQLEFMLREKLVS